MGVKVRSGYERMRIFGEIDVSKRERQAHRPPLGKRKKETVT
jgi:hypothetical protein